jgi:5-methylcytosine-specific restriction protein B
MGVGGLAAIEEHGSNRPDEGSLTDDDPRLLEVAHLLRFYGGVILSGPPGTSKSWYAAKIATKLTDGDGERYRFVQFHPSYQYEDFMQGFVPRKDGTGFELVPKYFVQMCQDALNDEERRLHILVIDELSRGDAGRVFGEALTYVEKSKRGLPFRLASGDECVVPDNLAIIATMNPLDRGVDEVDAAFERRFAKVAMDPDRDLLRGLLERNGVEDQLLRRIVGFFDRMTGMARTNPHAAVGHTFFADVRDLDSARAVWNYQLRFLVEKAYRLDPVAREEIEAAWARVVGVPVSEDESSSTGDEEATPEGEDAEQPVAEPPPAIDGGQP